MGTHPIFESDFDCLTDTPLKKWPTHDDDQDLCLVSRFFSLLRTYDEQFGCVCSTIVIRSKVDLELVCCLSAQSVHDQNEIRSKNNQKIVKT